MARSWVMRNVTAHELQFRTDEVLRWVQSGDQVMITVEQVPVAALMPVRTANGPRPMSKTDFLKMLDRRVPDANQLRDLEWLSTGDTDDLGPI